MNHPKPRRCAARWPAASSAALGVLAVLAVLAALALPRPAAASLTWEEALARADARGDRLLVVVGASWCGACEDLDEGTLRDLRVASVLRDDWVVVHVDADRRPDVRRLLQGPFFGELPSLHFLDPSARLLLRSGPMDAPALLDTLDRLAGGTTPAAPLAPQEPAGSTGRTPVDAYRRALRDYRQALEHAGGLDAHTPLNSNEVSLLVDLAGAEPETFAAPLADFLAGVMASPRWDAVDGGFRPGPDCGKPLEVQAAMIEALMADAAASPERATDDRAAVAATVDFLTGRLLDPETGLFHASESADGAAVDSTFLLSANARAAAALIDAGRRFKKRDWVKAGHRVRTSIPRVLVDDRRNLLHWRDEAGTGPSQPEDWSEWGRLLLRAEEGEDRARAREAVLTLRDRFVDPGRGLLPRPAEDRIRGVPVAPLGNDAARTIRFLADWADQEADGEITFLAMGLLDGLVADPDVSPASVALSARPMARQ